MRLDVGLAADPVRWAAFRELVIEYEASLPPDLRHADLKAELTRLEQSYGPPHAAFAAMVDQAPAGCIAFTRLDATTVIVKKLYVPTAYRRRGIARALLAALTDTARARGHARLVLDTDRDRLAAAYALYLSLGFRACAPYGEVDYASPAFMELAI